MNLIGIIFTELQWNKIIYKRLSDIFFSKAATKSFTSWPTHNWSLYFFVHFALNVRFHFIKFPDFVVRSLFLLKLIVFTELKLLLVLFFMVFCMLSFRFSWIHFSSTYQKVIKLIKCLWPKKKKSKVKINHQPSSQAESLKRPQWNS